MSGFFSEIGIPALDFIQISALFLLTMLIFFGVKRRRYLWLNYLSLLTFILQWMIVVLFREGLPVKIFGTLMLTSAIIVEAVVSKRRNPRATR